MLNSILTIVFAILAGLGVVVSITGLTKPEKFISFEQKCQKKILKRELSPDKLTRGMIKRMAFILICVTAVLSTFYISFLVAHLRMG